MIDTLVLKAVKACNLRCDYCYYINEQTEGYGTWMQRDVVRALYESLATYAEGRLDTVNLIWHGGEPLLLGRRKFQEIIDLQGEYFRQTAVSNRLQTNGALVGPEWVDFFVENDIGVGVSLDGPRELHDQQRRDVRGRGTFDAVVSTLRQLEERKRGVGVLAVAGENGDGAELIRTYRELGVRACDILLPMTNHAVQRHLAGPGGGGAIDFETVGEFLCAAFREWTEVDLPWPRVRIFEALMMNALGLPQACTNAGANSLDRVVVVEPEGWICMDTDFGEIDRFGLGHEYHTGLNVRDQDFTFAAAERALAARIAQQRLDTLPAECRACPVRSVCRGSHPASRFDDVDGSYDHPSAYCAAMYALSVDVVTYLAEQGFAENLLAPELRSLVPDPA